VITGTVPKAAPGGPDAAGDVHALQGVPPGEVVWEGDIAAGGRKWRRIVVKTHVIRPGEDIAAVVAQYAGALVRPGDVAVIGQKATSIAQGRLVREDDVHPSRLAVMLSRRVTKSPYGYGLGKPTTMEVALREAGVCRILAAAAVHVLTRTLLGRTGDFYRVAGRAVAAIDGTTDWALPPYNRYIVLAPERPDQVASGIAARLGAGVGAAIVDLNDVGSVDRRVVAAALRDNPLRQGAYQTPLAVVRPLGLAWRGRARS
jgi:F420-0:gamma-glutamyl ligase-like protein